MKKYDYLLYKSGSNEERQKSKNQSSTNERVCYVCGDNLENGQCKRCGCQNDCD